MDLRFHWMLPKPGEVAMPTALDAVRFRCESMTSRTSPARLTDMDGWLTFAKHAEEAGIDSSLIALTRHEPDPLLVACALAQETEKLKFIVAYRSGLMQPATFVQQFNTLSRFADGRVALNLVAGSSTAEQHGYGDFLSHDERYARAEEFLAVCHAFWRGNDVDFDGRYYQVERGRIHTTLGGPAPEIYISGHSEQSEELAVSQGTTWLRVADAPEKLQPSVGRMRARGTAVCLSVCIICRPTRDEAIRHAQSMLPAGTTSNLTAVKDDSRMYAESAAIERDAYFLKPWLWAGLAPHYGPVWTTLVGTPDDVAEAFIEYKRIGVSEFILSGWPEIAELDLFGREVLPRVRERESRMRGVA
ncbi:MAG: alkanesulfonate monooxygenase [Acidobacteriota bacterium]|jgi:alkanesulfonate monooxygenase|nr:alkanesulfonate monooxygenase [Acidobacteriota bacterium]